MPTQTKKHTKKPASARAGTKKRPTPRPAGKPARLVWLKRLISIRWVRVVLGIAVGLLILMYTAPWWNPVVFPPVKNPQFGVSFSEKRARELGLDWRANYLALLDDMQIKHYRLMSYWDLHEPVRGQHDFSTLDWQIAEAKKRGASVSLAIGLRQPRWPECHQPEWANTLTGGAWKQAMYSYIQTVVKHYENEPTVINWQLENEGKNDWFGLCDRADRVRLQEEYDMVDRMTKKPIWMSLSDQHGLPVFGPWPDKFGYSVYRVVWNEKIFPAKNYIIYPTPIWYHRARAVVIKAMTGRDIYIHELQLEPWGPRDTKDLSVDEQNISMSPWQIRDNVLFAREIGKPEIYTWGGEWWYWRKVHGDPSIWNTVKDTLRDAETDTR